VSRNDDTPSLRDILAARRRIADIAYRTPLEISEPLSELAGAAVHLKLECWQRTRSFKVRGAYNAIAALPPTERARGLVTASAGNHGQAVALAARELGARALIYVPESAPQTKRQRILSLGATLCAGGADYDEAERRAWAHAQRDGSRFVHAFSDPDVVAGQGTIGLEIAEALPAVREVVVPVGGGGLIGGIALALRGMLDGVRVIGVQSTQTRAMHAAFEAGRVVPVPVPPTLADGLAGGIDERAFRLARRVVDEIVLVEEAEIADALRVLHQRCGVTAEGSAAVGVAALLSGRVTLQGPAVLVITGANIDADRLAAVLSGAPS
jgi:threonine dehydratase